MMTLNFDDLQDLIQFLNFNSIMSIWEVSVFKLSASYGMQMEINTKYNDPLGLISYMQFESLKPMLLNFYEQNSHLNMNVEIRMIYPERNRKIMDPNNCYSAFYLNIFSNAEKTFMNVSYTETSQELPEEPITSWCVYIAGLYNDYQNSKN